jgi:hypothetical protein
VTFNAATTALIPLYAVGVFMSFSLSQTGMAVRWWKSGRLKPGQELHESGSTVHHDRRWKLKLVINGFGAIFTCIAMFVFAITKFASGAWIVVLIIPSLVFIFFRIHRHYKDLAAELSLDSYGAPPRIQRHRVIVPVSGVHRGTLRALHYARSISPDVTAVHIVIDPAEEQRTREKWDRWGDGLRLQVIQSPYRLLLEPLLDYIRQIAAQRQPNEILTVVVPEFVPSRGWHNLLHMQTALLLRMGLLGLRNIIITEAPYHLGD